MNESDDLKPKETLGWLGEVSEEDFQRASTRLEDAYEVAQEDPIDQTKILEAYVVPSRGDPKITKLLLLGGYLLLATTGLQMLRSDSLHWPGPEKSPSPPPVTPRSAWAAEQPKGRSVSVKNPLPGVSFGKARKGADGKVVIMVGLQNLAFSPTSPAVVSIVFSSEQESFQVQGDMPILPPRKTLEVPIQTPFSVEAELDEDATRFLTTDGRTVDFKIHVEAAE